MLVTPGVAAHVYVDCSGAGLTAEATPQAVAGAIRTLLAADRKKLGQQARAFVEQNLSWPTVLQQIDTLYRELIA